MEIFKQTEAQILILKKRFAKPSCEFFVLATKLTITTRYLGTVFSRFHAVLVIEDWIRILQIITDPIGSGSTTLLKIM